MFKPNWKSPPQVGMALLTIGGIAYTVGAFFGVKGHPYEPFMLLVFAPGLMLAVMSSIAFVQIVRFEQKMDEEVRQHNESNPIIKIGTGWR